MAGNLWKDNKGHEYITAIEAEAWRLESRGNTSLRKLVDSAKEQVILEELIDQRIELFAPFKNPPLKFGSRFSKRVEPSLWYGSLAINTALAEKAFYTFNFLRASKAFAEHTIEYSLTLIAAQIKTSQGVLLNQLPFHEYNKLISSPSSYETSQRLGAAMRAASIEAFVYPSARDPDNGPNVGLFTPRALRKMVSSTQTWQCIASKDIVEFIRANDSSTETKSFPIELFLIEGDLPFPAN